MTQVYKVVIERDMQGGYTATFPELVDCRTQAVSLKALMERIREVVAHCPEAADPVAARQPTQLYREAEG